MITRAYRLTCLTNLHMGDGQKNFGIVDLEVQRDTVTKEPTMHSSGIKGAIRHHLKDSKDEDINRLFGTGEKAGELSFFDADLVFRPCRVTSENYSKPFILTSSYSQLAMIEDKCISLSAPVLSSANSSAYTDKGLFFTDSPSPSSVEIEGEYKVEKSDDIPYNTLIKKLLLAKRPWAILPSRSLEKIELPIIAHNVIDEESGQSKNFWWQEVVPHESIFITWIAANSADNLNCFEKLVGLRDGENLKPVTLQFGANNSTGLGFMLMESLGAQKK